MQSFEIGDYMTEDDDNDNDNDDDDDCQNDLNNDATDDNTTFINGHQRGRGRRNGIRRSLLERKQNNDRRSNRQERRQLRQLRRSQSAIDRLRKWKERQEEVRRIEQELLSQQQSHSNTSNSSNKRNNFITGSIKVMGNVLQKVNVGNWIDQLEQEQVIIDSNRRNEQEEKDRQRIIQQAHDACMDAIREHLVSFLQEYSIPTTTTTTTTSTTTSTTSNNPTIGLVTYEDWIHELHPDNIIISKDDGTEQLDPRYYLVDSDHRLLWNELITQMDSTEQQQQQQQQNHSTTTTINDSTSIMKHPSRIVPPRSMIDGGTTSTS